MNHAVAPSARLRSLDALRGFDMFWIIGGDALVSEIAKLAPNPAVQALCAQFSEHVEWEGFHYYDMIFPLFLFIIGAVLPFSIGKRLESGEPKAAVFQKVIQRTALLFFAGLVFNGLLQFPGWAHVRIFGVLQRQALGYGFAATLMIYTKPRTQAVVGVAILFVYWAIMALIPVPGHPLGSMTEWGNVANYVDRLILLPGQMYEKYGDPEGPLSTIPAVTTALIGVFAGYLLKSSKPDRQKILTLVAAGAVCLVLGVAWMPFFPVIKKIWTSSYVLVAGGFSLELLALAYWAVDVKGWAKWAFPLIIIGMNPLTIYFLSEIVDFGKIADYFFRGALDHVPFGKAVLFAVGVLAFKWLLLRYLYEKKTFWRI